VDWKIFILGVTPPILAILAEFFNPVSEQVIREQVSSFRGTAWEITPRQTINELPPPGSTPNEDISKSVLAEITNPVSREIVKALLNAAMARHAAYLQTVTDAEETSNNNVHNVAQRIAEISSAAVEISAIIPTWISVTAAIATILVDLVGNLKTTGFLLAWTLVSGLAGFKFFTSVNYYRMVAHLTRWAQAIGDWTGKQLLSGLLIVANVIVIAFVAAVACHSSEPKPAKASQVSTLSTKLNLIAGHADSSFPDTELTEKIHALGRTVFLLNPARTPVRRHHRANASAP
jgi:hypothetical protein